MYHDRGNLERAVRSLGNQFGLAMLDEPNRTRNLLLDEMGSSGSSSRADIESFVSALSVGRASLVGQEPAEFVAQRVAIAANLPMNDAVWTVNTLRAVTPTPEQRFGAGVGDPFAPPDLEGATVIGRVGPPPSIPLSPAAPSTGGGWPSSARNSVIVAGALVVALLVALVVIAVRSSSETAKWKDQVTELQGALARTSTSGTDKNQTLQEQLAEIRSENAALTTENTGLKNELDLSQRDANTKQRTIDQQAQQIDRIDDPIPVDVSGHLFTGSFRGTLSLVTCSGFAKCVESTTYPLSGYFTNDGKTSSLTSPNNFTMPLVGDGFVSTGATTASAARFNCTVGGVTTDTPTQVTVQVVPKSFWATPGQAASANEYYIRITLFTLAGASRCTPASETYVGVLKVG